MSGGSSPPPATSTTTVQQSYGPEEAAARAKLWKIGGDIFADQQKQGPQAYPGAAPVPFSPETKQAQNMLLGTASGAGTTLGNNASYATNFGLTGDVLSPTSNPALDANIKAAQRRVTEATMDPSGPLAAIRSQFGGSAGTGTREQIASGIAGRSYLNTIGDISSSMQSEGYNKGLDYMKSSMAFAPQSYNLLMQPSMAYGAVGAQKEGLGQEYANYDAAKGAWNYNAPWAQLQPYANLMSGMSSPATTTTGTSPTGTANRAAPLGMALSGAAAGAQIGSLVPGLGTAAGAGVGAGIGLLAGLL